MSDERLFYGWGRGAPIHADANEQFVSKFSTFCGGLVCACVLIGDEHAVRASAYLVVVAKSASKHRVREELQLYPLTREPTRSIVFRRSMESLVVLDVADLAHFESEKKIDGGSP